MKKGETTVCKEQVYNANDELSNDEIIKRRSEHKRRMKGWTTEKGKVMRKQSRSEDG